MWLQMVNVTSDLHCTHQPRNAWFLVKGAGECGAHQQLLMYMHPLLRLFFLFIIIIGKSKVGACMDATRCWVQIRRVDACVLCDHLS